MNWDELSAISTFVTMIVIAASAIAAVFQLRHMRAGNAITAFVGFWDRWASPQAREIANYVFSGAVEKKLQNPAYRREVFSSQNVDRLAHPEFQYLDFWESIGMFVKLGYFAEDAVMESGGPIAVRAWQVLMPVIAIVRDARGPAIYDNFEYLVSRAMLWETQHPGGVFPKRTPHLPVVNSFSNESGDNDA
jgi:hypothetical protein